MIYICECKHSIHIIANCCLFHYKNISELGDKPLHEETVKGVNAKLSQALFLPTRPDSMALPADPSFWADTEARANLHLRG